MIEFTEQELLEDALVSHKYLIFMYNQFGIEGSNPAIRKLFTDLHTCTMEYNFEIFEIMNAKGYYPTTEAATKDVKQAIKMHTEMQSELDAKLKC